LQAPARPASSASSSDGYLGFVKTPSAELKSAVDAVNIKRRAIYTEIAAKQNATVQEVATARGCDQLAKRVAPGEWYSVGGSWAQRAPVRSPCRRSAADSSVERHSRETGNPASSTGQGSGIPAFAGMTVSYTYSSHPRG
jgi:uncharacterized protein YdbL (DUF1318 family)